MPIKKTVLLLLAYATLISSIHAQIQIGQDIDGEAAGDNSGRSVSLSSDGKTIAIGANGNDGNGTDAGNVRVYSWNGNAWVQKGIDIDGEAAEDRLGTSVSLSSDGNTIAIGAPYNDGNGSNAGHVRVYSWNGSAWVQQGIDIDGEAASDFSGISVSLSLDGNTVAIGAYLNDGNGSEAGHVRIYRWNGSAWLQKGIDIDGEYGWGHSGLSVSLSSDGNTIAIGADLNGTAGHVRVYSWNGSVWVQKGIDIDGEATDDRSGNSVSLSSDGETLAIGARVNDGNGIAAGHVRIYTWNGSVWVQKGIDIDGEAAGDISGQSVSMSFDGNTVAIGADYNDGSGSAAGHVRVYSWNGSTWVQKGIDIDGEATDDRSGVSVSLGTDGNTVAIGAFWNDGNGADAGHVRVYKFKGVSGSVYNDINENCIQEVEIGLQNRKAIIQPGDILVETYNNGNWHLDSLPAGVYTIAYDTSGKWRSTCQNPLSFTITDPDDFTQTPSFGFVNTEPCPEPNVSIAMPFMRPGVSNQKIYVNACNESIATGALNSSYAIVELDELLTFDAASLAYTNLGNNTYRVDLGTLNPGQCMVFNVSATISTTAVLGQTLCMEANLFPADNCVFDTIPAEPVDGISPCTLPWDKSSIKVDGWCENDSIYFTVTNTGDFGEGDMQCYAPVRLFIDGVYMKLDSILLLGGETDTLVFSGDGRTWRLEVDQHPLHPGNSHPNATVELCGNADNWTPDLVNILPMDDAEPVVDIYCGLVTGSYDPNDKTGYPLGVGETHHILPNGKMEYLIRFQNTGTDTAFTVVVRDTLDTDFNIFSVRSGASSHNYSFKMHGPRVLEWTFNNILLPDSSTNQEGSNGFVSFTVDQNPNLPDGTEFNNKVGIYFDFNEPIITNTTSHVVDRGIKTKEATVQKSLSLQECGELALNGLVYKNSGAYYQMIEGGANPDTLLTLEATILPISYSLTNITSCNSYTWTDGNSYDANGTFTQVLTNVAGCDSVVTLELVITESTSSTTNISECESYLWADGNTYDASGSYSQTLTNSAGCDSLATLELVILESTSSTTNISECDSYTWTDGNTYNLAGTYSQFLTNTVGCDSVATLALVLLDNESTTSITSCNSYTWTDGNTYNASGTYTQLLTNAAGCDSIATLELTINESTASTTNITSCDSYTWTDGNTYDVSGTFTQLLTNAVGCDSVATLELIITESTASTTSITSCESYTWTDGNTYDISGTYSQLLTNAAGCDSVATLELVILESTATTTNITSCNSYTWTDGNTYDASGTYTQLLTNAAGCDSVATLELVITESTTSTTSVTSCDGYTWTDGNTYDASGTYTLLLTNAAGCDSMATLELVITESTASTTSITSCDSYVWTDDNSYDVSGTYTQLLTNAAGCDSIVTLELTINESTSSTTAVFACESYTWSDGVTYYNSGSYSQTLVNIMGCDSTATLDLSLGLDTDITLNGATLSSNVSADAYQWLDCANNFSEISGATNATFTPEMTGIYALSLEQNNCSDTSSCYYVYINAQKELANMQSIRVVPNPTNGKITLLSTSLLAGASVKVFNTLGEVVYSSSILSSTQTEIDLSELSSGVYFLMLKQDERQDFVRVVKND